MNCRWTHEQLPLYCGGDLEEQDASKVRKHLADCSGCRAESELFSAALEDLARQARCEFPPLPAATRHAIAGPVLDRIAPLARERRNRSRLSHILARRSRFSNLSWAAAAALLLAICVGLARDAFQSPTTPQGVESVARPDSPETPPSSPGLPEESSLARSPVADRFPLVNASRFLPHQPNVVVLRQVGLLPRSQPGLEIYSIRRAPRVESSSTHLDF